MPLSRGLYIPGDPSPLEDLSSPSAEWVQTALMLGRKLIISEWKASSAPSVNLWYNHWGRLAALEGLTYRLMDRVGSFHLKWERYLSSIQGSD